MKVTAITVFVAGCLFLLCASATAQSPAPASTPALATSATPAATPTTVYTLPPDKLEKSKALYDLRGKLRIFGTIYGLVVLLAILYLGVMARYRDWAERAFKYSFPQALIAIPLLLLTLDILD